MISGDDYQELMDIAFRIRSNVSHYWQVRHDAIGEMQRQEFIKEIRKLGHDILNWCDTQEYKQEGI